MEKDVTKCGFAALIGRPNVGKSTLVNKILDQKLSIVTSKPQTTRNRILAIYDKGPVQTIFLDTPGIHKPRGSLGRYMVEAALGAISESDVCLWILDATHHTDPPYLRQEDKELAALISKEKKPLIGIINKIDLIRDKNALLPLMETLAATGSVDAQIPLSALTGDGIDILTRELTARLPKSPKLYPEDMISDQAERFFVSELVREALTELTHKELPYASAVTVDRFVEETDRVLVYATIHVEKPSHKGIVIGKSGSMIKEIGTRARIEAENLLRCKVDLVLHVNVSPAWSRSDDGIRKMGYE